MMVFSVFVTNPDNGSTELRATFYEEWAAERYASSTDTDCDRRVVEHQLLNFSERRYIPAARSGSAAPR